MGRFSLKSPAGAWRRPAGLRQRLTVFALPRRLSRRSSSRLLSAGFVRNDPIREAQRADDIRVLARKCSLAEQRAEVTRVDVRDDLPGVSGGLQLPPDELVEME